LIDFHVLFTTTPKEIAAGPGSIGLRAQYDVRPKPVVGDS
jgi:hypothetical protein